LLVEARHKSLADKFRRFRANGNEAISVERSFDSIFFTMAVNNYTGTSWRQSGVLMGTPHSRAEAFVCTLLPPEGGVPLAMKCANVNMNCHPLANGRRNQLGIFSLRIYPHSI
jgi:hypothetical protein